MISNPYGLTKKQQRFIDEYFKDFNASAAYVRAGYAGKNANGNSYKLMQSDKIKQEIERRLSHLEISPKEVMSNLSGMAMGAIPTKVVTGSHAREEYDRHGANVSLGRVFALFKDKIELDIQHLNITDEDA